MAMKITDLTKYRAHLFHLSTLSNERGSILFFKKNKLIGNSRVDVAFGDYKSVLVDGRKVLDEAENMEADEVVFCHNHPGGKANPSKADFRSAKHKNNIGIDKRIFCRFVVVAGNNIGSYGGTIEPLQFMEFYKERNIQ